MSPQSILLALSFAFVAPLAHAKPPAYFVSNVGFATQIHGVPDGERREECFDMHCTDRGGAVVAEGEAQGIRTVIREHKRSRELKRNELEQLAGKLLSHDAEGRALRTETGHGAAGHNAMEQWIVQGACGRTIKARVLFSLANKVIEIETSTSLGSDVRDTEQKLGRMHEILRGVRIRRLGDEALDPVKTPPPVRDMMSTLEKC